MDERDSLQLQLAQLQKQLSAKNEETEDFSKLVAAAAMQARLAGDWAELRRRLKRRANALSLRAETFSERPGFAQCLSVKNELEAKAALLQDCFSKLSGTQLPEPRASCAFTERSLRIGHVRASDAARCNLPADFTVAGDSAAAGLASLCLPSAISNGNGSDELRKKRSARPGPIITFNVGPSGTAQDQPHRSWQGPWWHADKPVRD